MGATMVKVVVEGERGDNGEGGSGMGGRITATPHKHLNWSI